MNGRGSSFSTAILFGTLVAVRVAAFEPSFDTWTGFDTGFHRMRSSRTPPISPISTTTAIRTS